MPTYEYRCKQCDHELEAVQGFHDEPLTECPACGGQLRKKFGSVGISFKGSGFYKNDSRGSRSSSSSNGESGSSDSSTSDAASSSDSASSTSTGDGTSSKSDKATKKDSGSTTKTPATT